MKKIFSVFIMLVVAHVVLLIIIFSYVPFMYVPSSTAIKIVDANQKQYEEIKKDIRQVVTNLTPPFDCEYGQKELGYTPDELIACHLYNYGTIYISKEDNNVKISYSGGTSFLLPTNEKISDEHKEMQQLFLKLGAKYKKQYQKDVKVIFYHSDLPKDGRRLF